MYSTKGGRFPNHDVIFFAASYFADRGVSEKKKKTISIFADGKSLLRSLP